MCTKQGVEPLNIRLDNEIKTLERMKDFCIKRAKIEKDYAHALEDLNRKYAVPQNTMKCFIIFMFVDEIRHK